MRKGMIELGVFGFLAFLVATVCVVQAVHPVSADTGVIKVAQKLTIDSNCTLPTVHVTRTPVLGGGQKFEINVTNKDGTQYLTINKLIGTGKISPTPSDVEYHMNGNAYFLWDLPSPPGNLATFVGENAPIAPGGTETFDLDYLTITGTHITIPSELEYDFGVFTNCGTVWSNQTQEIYSLNSPHPNK